jgi:predicted glycogen debranching enzyme
MSYLEFDKKELINLEYSLSREILRSNRAGSYASYTLVGCNTRKYHGLLVSPMEHLDGDKHVLLSSLDLSIINNATEFNLGIHKYSNETYVPKGHKYVQDFQTDDVPQIYYRIGGVRIVRESILLNKEQHVLIRYTILEADRPIKLKFTPFLAFRNTHSLSKANMHVNTHIKYIENGIKSHMYDGYPYLHMQFSKKVEYVHVPDWYYNIEYSEEEKRGYDFREDLFVPGYFETTAKQGDSIVFAAGTKELPSSGLKKKFSANLKNRIPRNSFKNCLLNSAEQFIFKKEKDTVIIGGYHWLGSLGRNTFFALPGLCLSNEDTKTFLAVTDTLAARIKNGLIPSKNSLDEPIYNSVDASLWFIWALQQYYHKKKDAAFLWKKYKAPIKNILTNYLKGTQHNIHMLPNGLIYAGETGLTLTWMDSVVNGIPITPRTGCSVEVNALWYNAICFCLELAEKTKDAAFIKSWKKWPAKIQKSFIQTFWSTEKEYLADFADGENTNWDIRPNQIIAAAMPYSPLTDEIKNAVTNNVKRYLLTPRGLRSLAPEHPEYIGIYQGNQEARERATHQGSVWPWLLEHYCQAYLQLHKNSGIQHVKNIISDFEQVINEHGIGSISELYDGDPPHAPKGCISHAGSVASLLRIIEKIEAS